MKKVAVVTVFLILLGGHPPRPGEARQPQKVQQVMIDKLKNAKLLLEGLALADFKKIERSAEELIQLSKTAEWLVLRTPRYEVHSNDFRRAAEAVAQKARAKNIDGVALAYVEMTLSCVKCHQYVREVRDARLELPGAAQAVLRRPPTTNPRP
jgi:hypothetical protein